MKNEHDQEQDHGREHDRGPQRDHRMPWRLSIASAVCKALCMNGTYLLGPNEAPPEIDPEKIARDAFAVADALLREFKKPRAWRAGESKRVDPPLLDGNPGTESSAQECAPQRGGPTPS